jgi:hypothetical protein
VGKDWVAKKVLRRGGFGIVGWWTYEGNDEGQKRMVDVVVKQARFLRYDRTRVSGLNTEFEFLELFRNHKCRHILRVYRKLYTDVGQGTSEYDQGDV